MSRCQECNKKLGLFEYKCKCEKIFCITHLHAESHKCDYDYKTNTRKQLDKENEILYSLKHKNFERI